MTTMRSALAGLLLALAWSAAGAQERGETWAAQDEVFYHVFVRSFRDSDGDRIGDLRGIQQGLDHLQDLGITSLLLSPIQPSPFYHNYFATSFDGIEPAYGDSESWRDLVAAVHQRGMKIYLDVEIQYVAEGHPWWRESAGRPGSPYTPFMMYHGPGNTQPESAVYGLTTTPTWDGRSIGLATINLREPAVLRYFQRMLTSLADPDSDGRFADGVDGFRIDHMMDDLDGKGVLTNLFADFWAPLFTTLRQLNPRLRIIAEQFDWGYGEDFLTRGGADLVFSFPVRQAIVSFDRDRIAAALAETARRTPSGKGQLIFIENHDVNRFASEAGGDPRKLKVGAALATLLRGTPSIYYGQELGMRGRRHEGWTADGTDIPDREAFEWERVVESTGAALWYRDTGPWWTERYARDDDGISLEEQQRDPASLLSFYRQLLTLRRSRPELVHGDQQVVPTDQARVLAVLRTAGEHRSLLLVNLANEPGTVRPAWPEAWRNASLRDLISVRVVSVSGALELEPWAVVLLGVPAPAQ